MENINILITGAGAPGIKGTVYSIKKDFSGKLIGTDLREDCVGKYFMDKIYKIPKPSEKFIERIIEICKLEEIKVVVPQVTKELIWFAKYKKRFEENGIKVLISDYESLKIVNDKFEILKACKENEIDCCGDFFLVSSLKELKEISNKFEEFVVKIPDSNGMRGLRIVKKGFDKFNDFINNKPGNVVISFEELLKIFENQNNFRLLVTEYFPGKEYSVDILADKGKLVICVPRSRDIIRTGITFEGITENNLKIIELSKKIIKALDLDYLIGLQFKIDKNGKLKLLESNPRVQGTMVHSTLANANIISGAIKLALGLKNTLTQDNVKWGVKLKRYWGAFSEDREQIDQV
jgi:carbamoyl-phosphate synthase large subunit